MAEEEPLGAEREPTWDQKVVKLNEVLAERNIPYAFGGAIALNYHCEPRSTLDINIFLSPEHEHTVLSALGDVYDVAVLLFGVGVAVAVAGPRPPFVKACGSIHAKGHKQRVDIAEANGHVSHSCSAARAVMRRFLHRAPAAYTGPNNAQVNFRGKTFSCYVSRPDGEGWSYHCNWFSSNATSLIDYGAGRRS